MEILPQLIMNSLIAGSVYALMAMGFNLSYGATKFFNFAHGIIAAIGGYAVFYFYRTLGVDIYLSILLAVSIAGAIGFLLEKTIYLPLRKRKSSEMVLLVASLGVFTVLQSAIAILFTSQFRSLSDADSSRVYEFFGAAISRNQLVILLSSVTVLIAVSLILKKTIFGKAVKAISDDEEVSKIVGINTDKMIGFVFLISSAVAGLTGLLVGFDTGIEPGMGLSLLLKGVIASVIGGIGSVYGGFLGGFILSFAENFGIWKIPGEWKDAIAFGLLIVFLIFKPRGLISR